VDLNYRVLVIAS